MRQLASFNRYSKNRDVPNNALDKVTHTVLWCNSTSARGIQEHNRTQNCDTLPDTYKKCRECQSYDCSLNQRYDCDEVSDMIITMKPLTSSKTNLYATPETWSNVLRSCKNSTPETEDSSQVVEQCLRNQREACMWPLNSSVLCRGNSHIKGWGLWRSNFFKYGTIRYSKGCSIQWSNMFSSEKQ